MLVVFGTLFSSGAMSRWSLKVCQPFSHQRQAISFDAIDTHSALPLVPQEASSFKNLKVPSGGLPCMRKDRRDLSRGHRASVEVDREQYATPGRVSQRTEYGLIRVGTNPRGRLQHQ
jgi:hypothetical protein